MGLKGRSRGLLGIAALVAAALVILFALGVFTGGRPKAVEPGREAEVAAPLGGSHGGIKAQNPKAEGPPAAAVARGGSDPGAEPEPLSSLAPSDTAEGAYPVNLEALRARLPENLYWRLGAPTKDPVILEQRAEEERRWNELFGKVQSNTASRAEIHRYYEHRREVSEDYIEFASLVLRDYGAELPERDKGLYELSIKMHRGRLAEIPREIEDALARKEAHDKRKEELR